MHIIRSFSWVALALAGCVVTIDDLPAGPTRDANPPAPDQAVDARPDGGDAGTPGCPSDDDVDSDRDGVPDACDVCPGSDDGLDADDDGVPDGCQMCEVDAVSNGGFEGPDIDAASAVFGAGCDPGGNRPPCSRSGARPGIPEIADWQVDPGRYAHLLDVSFWDEEVHTGEQSVWLTHAGTGLSQVLTTRPGGAYAVSVAAMMKSRDEPLPENLIVEWDGAEAGRLNVGPSGEWLEHTVEVVAGGDATTLRFVSAAGGLAQAPIIDSIRVVYRGPCTAPDSDRDGVVDGYDVCPDFDDGMDSDGDGVPDGCDICLGHDDALDADGDGVPDGCDPCPDGGPPDGRPDGPRGVDSDGDTVPDGCDLCADFDDRLDADGDTVPDGCDVCPGADDTVDADGDGVPDGCPTCDVDIAANGGFEEPDIDVEYTAFGAGCDPERNDVPCSNSGLDTGVPEIPAWRLDPGTYAHIFDRSYRADKVHAGEQSIWLTANGRGVTQTLPTRPGETYTVRVAASAHGSADPPPGNLLIEWGGVAVGHFDSGPSEAWRVHEVQVVAENETTTLRLAGAAGRGGQIPIIDSISVVGPGPCPR